VKDIWIPIPRMKAFFNVNRLKLEFDWTSLGVKLVGLVFLISAIVKWTNPMVPVKAMLTAKVPDELIYPILMSLVAVEVSIGCLLIWYSRSRRIILVGIWLMLAFVAFIIRLLFLNKPTGCGCGVEFSFFKSEHANLVISLIRNFLLMGLLFRGFRRAGKGSMLDSSSSSLCVSFVDTSNEQL